MFYLYETNQSVMPPNCYQEDSNSKKDLTHASSPNQDYLIIPIIPTITSNKFNIEHANKSKHN